MLQNIYSNRSSLVLRALLREPEKKWTIQDLAGEGISFGHASEALSKAESLGYVQRILKGPDSHTRLIRKEELLKDWLRSYSFDRNQQAYYLTTDKDFLKKCAQYLNRKKKKFALTLYSASRLISPYVKDNRHFIYLDIDREKFPVLRTPPVARPLTHGVFPCPRQRPSTRWVRGSTSRRRFRGRP